MEVISTLYMNNEEDVCQCLDSFLVLLRIMVGQNNNTQHTCPLGPYPRRSVAIAIASHERGLVVPFCPIDSASLLCHIA